MKLMVQCPQVNHHLLLPQREFMTFVSDASQFDNKRLIMLLLFMIKFCLEFFFHFVWCTCVIVTTQPIVLLLSSSIYIAKIF